MVCVQVAGYGYRRVPADSAERPYGRVIDWRNPSDLDVVATHTNPGGDLDIFIDIFTSGFYDEDRVADIEVVIDWADGNIETVNVNAGPYLHSYLAGGSYDAVVTVTSVYGICESVTETVVAIDV